MRKLLILIVAMTFLQAAISQEQEKGDKKSREILDNLTAQTESYNSIKVEFTYKMNNEEAGIDESTIGTLFIMGNKYKLLISGQQVISDGETIWTYIEDDEEVQINEMDEDAEGSLSPNKLLTSYNKDYKSNFVKETFQYGTTAVIIDLTPAEGKTYSKVRLIIDKAKNQILEITIFDKNGSTYTYLISKFIPNSEEIKESDFTFNSANYPDVDVIDMR
jgi:outer membrane lipoprotein-sorting protein